MLLLLILIAEGPGFSDVPMPLQSAYYVLMFGIILWCCRAGFSSTRSSGKYFF